jgi:CRISPR-associated endonuclease/helicase Cas3
MSFEVDFEHLTGTAPFPWQQALFERLIDPPDRWPTACVIPTGLGKTRVVDVWWLARRARPATVPTRLVYVVNRRTVVDQTTREVERLRDKVGADNLAVSTLRGQLADNREWSHDPSLPAVICGTVDMIGSRLLFSGYGSGFKSRPLHAGFLGQDVLLVHDEAHLEPAFQKLLEAIVHEQGLENDPLGKRLQVLQLTATVRGTDREQVDENTVVRLTEEEQSETGTPSCQAVEIARQRLGAVKRIALSEADPKEVGEAVTERALALKDSGRAVLVFLRTVKDVEKCVDKLGKELKDTSRVGLLTGTMRGFERDQLIETPVFRRFLPDSPADEQPQSSEETVYLVCTSAGEVGVNISADDLVCDLSPLDSMAQRFGRVNRLGLLTDTRIEVVCPASFDEKDRLGPARKLTRELLERLGDDASPRTLGPILRSQEARDAFTPEPKIPEVSEILFDAWSLTTIREPLPGRPPVAPYLHGIVEGDPPQTRVAWREEVEKLEPNLFGEHPPATLLEEYPLKPLELLADDSGRVHEHLVKMARRQADLPVWLVADDGLVTTLAPPPRLRDATGEKQEDTPLTLGLLAEKVNRELIEGKTVLLPPSAGGLLDSGLMDGSSEKPVDDVADLWGQVRATADAPLVADNSRFPLRRRLWNPSDEDLSHSSMRVLRRIVLGASEDDDAVEGTEPTSIREWYWLERESDEAEASTRGKSAVTLATHTSDVERKLAEILDKLSLDDRWKRALRAAATWHDVGKDRKQFQRVLGNLRYPRLVLAKSGSASARSRLTRELYRHEFGSLRQASRPGALDGLSVEERELALHVIAAHHGRARPHFPDAEAFDPLGTTTDNEAVALETLRRFARLQRRYGRWGLAYLESLLRAADYAASADPSETHEEQEAQHERA